MSRFLEPLAQLQREVNTAAASSAKDVTVTVRRYVVQADGETGIFLVASDGVFAVVSSIGNYAFKWSAPGDCFRRFLATCGADYLANKLEHQFGVPKRNQSRQLDAFLRRLWPAFARALADELDAEQAQRVAAAVEGGAR